MPSSANLFTSLFRWAHRQDENFVTESLVYIINCLLEDERSAGLALVGWLLNLGKGEWVPDGLSVSTQYVTDEGRPDILIQCEDLIAFVEVKKGSGLGFDQLERYRTALNRHARGGNSRLVLLSQFPVWFDEGQARPDVHRRWHELSRFCESQPLTSPVLKFLVKQFTDFLESQAMAIESVSWQYLEGYRAFRNLCNMLATAIESAQIPIYAQSAGKDWTGWYVDGKRFWIGVVHERHNIVQFELSALIDIDRLKEICTVEKRSDKFAVELQLDSEAVHFFSRTKEGQLGVLTDWVRNTYQAVQSCVREQPPNGNKAGIVS